jgi:hypothetical protein
MFSSLNFEGTIEEAIDWIRWPKMYAAAARNTVFERS